MPFAKGQSGNPAGRSKEVGRLRELLRAKVPEAVDAIVEALDDPKQCVAAAKVILEFGLGKPAQAVEVSGANGEKLQLQIVDFSKCKE